MNLLEGIETRRSFRAFKSTPVPEETLRKILKVASKSPSYRNSQPWEVAVVSNKKKDELGRILYGLAETGAKANPDIPNPPPWPPHLNKLIQESNTKRFLSVGKDPDDKQHRQEMRLLNFEFYGAPCVLFLFIDSTLGDWSVFDLGAFAQNIVLAAHSFGLGSCLQASLGNYPDAVREFLGITKTKKLLLGISIGYPDLDARVNSYQSSRVSPDEFVQWYR